jgi:hypothetical protein
VGISETIIAAIIGALATMLTAIVQLIRNRAPSEGRPKKSRMHSLVATIALMFGCIVGGYAWSSLRAVSAKDDLRATMEAEFTRQFDALAARQSAAGQSPGLPTVNPSGAALAARLGESGSAEGLAHLPPCRLDVEPEAVGPVTCTDRMAHPVALCAAIPASAQASRVRVQARVPGSEGPWRERDAGSAMLGDLKIHPQPAEFPVSADQRSVCLEVANTSVDDTLAVRLIVEYVLKITPATELTAATPTHSF